ncbi:hypothetical protein GGTG_06207 [Gaeumannomyces tritici R3-111a-1]|uniref:Uncharacterized protein n=1 Tax=Gaeumannomyces tritici (strain R3-111a-1) TaxID=644352 RepID=J3NY53_GAET3|nr:hypothetical protein GGTG_06207 [Gaeumannomyces tritici R3-111a-1]EJT76286.1 hypothetical protein GGTG_06207 [Gaeumannomyces tritici R3-111a-1]
MSAFYELLSSQSQEFPHSHSPGSIRFSAILAGVPEAALETMEARSKADATVSRLSCASYRYRNSGRNVKVYNASRCRVLSAIQGGPLACCIVPSSSSFYIPCYTPLASRSSRT